MGTECLKHLLSTGADYSDPKGAFFYIGERRGGNSDGLEDYNG